MTVSSTDSFLCPKVDGLHHSQVARVEVSARVVRVYDHQARKDHLTDKTHEYTAPTTSAIFWKRGTRVLPLRCGAQEISQPGQALDQFKTDGSFLRYSCTGRCSLTTSPLERSKINPGSICANARKKKCNSGPVTSTPRCRSKHT